MTDEPIPLEEARRLKAQEAGAEASEGEVIARLCRLDPIAYDLARAAEADGFTTLRPPAPPAPPRPRDPGGLDSYQPSAT